MDRLFVNDESGNIRAYLQQAAEIEGNAAELREKAARELCRPFMLLKPRIYSDGSQWCALYGDNIQDGVYGFGDTPAQAAIQFDVNWLNQKAYKE